MAKKSKLPSKVERELTATTEKLRARLAKAEAKAEKWKSLAKDAQKSVGSLEKKLVRQTERADKAKQRAKADKAARKVVEATVDQNAQERTEAAATEPAQSAVPAGEQVPDESWTVTRLRAAARDQGITGFSRKSKAQLLASLR